MGINQIMLVIIAAAVVVTVVALASGDESKKKLPRRAADVGGSAAVRVLRSFAVRQQCRVLGPLTFSQAERTVQLDAVLVGWFGVLGVKALGYNGQVYGDPKQPDWLWVTAEGRQSFANPGPDCELAARLMREALMKAGVRAPECEAVYVFTQPQVELMIPRGAAAMRTADLRAYLRKDKFHQDKGHDLDAMCAALAPFAQTGAG